MTTTIKANCLCGAAAHDITLKTTSLPLHTTLCHCDSCRHLTGTLSFACTRLPDDYAPDEKFVKSLTAFQFSPKIIQYNCSRCGAFVLSKTKRPDNASDHWDVMTGTLEQTDGVIDLRDHIYVGDTKDGGFADFLTTWQGKEVIRRTRYDDEDAVIPLDWSELGTEDDNKLHAYCKCGGVEFWIHRAPASNEHKPRPQPSVSGPMCSPELATWLRAEHASGMEITQWAYVHTSDITLDEAGKVPWQLQFGTLKIYNSSPGVSRCFCGVCGAMTFFKTKEREGLVDIGPGLFAASGARSENWLEWNVDRLGYREDGIGRADDFVIAVEDGLKQFKARHSS